MIEFKNEDFIHKAAESLYRSALIYQPSLIYSASDHNIGLAARLVATKLSLPFVYEMRGLWALSRSANNPDFSKSAKFNLMMRLERQCAQMADKLFVISQELKEVAISWGIDSTKIEIVPNGIRDKEITSHLEDFSNKKSDIVIGYFGAIVPYEGLDILVDSAQKLNRRLGNSKMRYLVVGDGTDKSRIEDLVREKRLNGQFTFTGKIPFDKIDDFYSEVNVIVIPRISHPVTEIIPALKPITAMGKAKLLVCSDVGPNKELISDGENGFLFTKNNSDSLADVLEMIAKNDQLLEIGARARDWASANRKWGDVINAASKCCARLMLESVCDSSTPDTKSAIDLIRMIFGDKDGSAYETQREFDIILPKLKKERDRRNLFLAFLRELGEINPNEGLNFGMENLDEFGDRRSVRTLITYANRTENPEIRKELMDKFSHELDATFSLSQKAKIQAYTKLDLKRRHELSLTPLWYTFDLGEFEEGKRLEIIGRADIELGDQIRSSLGRFEFLDKLGQLIQEAPEYLYRSNSVGYYTYLSPKEGVFKLPFLPPTGTSSIRVGFQLWEKDAKVSIHPRVKVRVSSSEVMREKLFAFGNSVKGTYGSDLIFMFSGTTYMNEVRANRPIRLTRVMLGRGNRVIFNYHRSDIREEVPTNDDDNLFQIPIDITTELIEEICEMDFGKCRKVFMISYPHPIIPKILHRFKQQGWVVIYDARDDWEEFSKVGQASWYRGWAEQYIVNNSDRSSAVSWPLAEKLSRYNEDGVSVVPNALSPKFRSENFEKIPERKNLVGYFGHLTDSWFDWDSLIIIANDLPDFRFEIIGHSEPKDLNLPDNIAMLGPKNHPEINKVAARWDAAMIPFKTGALSDAVDPIKIYEYLALGLPTISFTMPQINSYPLTKTYSDIEGFKKGLKWAVNLDVDMEETDAWLENNTWERRVEYYERWYDIR
jgi:glycosyltransferase involved in cell wall biosynthesis